MNGRQDHTYNTIFFVVVVSVLLCGVIGRGLWLLRHVYSSLPPHTPVVYLPRIYIPPRVRINEVVHFGDRM